MAWDSQNRMVSCLLNNQSSAFTYGADGLRRSMTVGSGPGSLTTDYAYDGQSMLREMQVNLSTGALAATATYLTGPRGPEYRRDDTQTETDGQGHTYGKTRWYVYDGLGSVVGEVDPLGNLTCSDEYDVYGAVRGRVGSASTAHGFVGNLGHLSDASTGLIYMRARYYDPTTGRFASQDPAKSGRNWFAYCDSNPITGQDFTGKIAGEDDYDEADLEAYISIRGDIADFSRAKTYSSQGMKNIIRKLTGVSDEEAGAAIHAAKDGLGGAAGNKNPDILIDPYGGLWAPGGDFLGFVDDFLN